MTEANPVMIYSFDIGEKSHYFLQQREAELAFENAELAGEHPEWREASELTELLAIKDALLGTFVKRIAFLELQLERAEMDADSFDLGAD
ncbi:hypothetical protein M0C34_13240 [Agarivorans sp. TSD2052]|uniref:hypothetical protein n=1 Tax=Agarivorans sp. TSD2052 TaxID=2937286 RepID=UPI00201034AA|nr:hypothetical protein [Agarivorans sp. TSD2052]UPW17206.1 hypothetical protein M0C34_13240 [Agarivorans sp. TSD2052]